jgi:hypothetical protein
MLAIKHLVCGLVLLPSAIVAQSSADFQAAIREATEQYRGDFAPGVSIVVCRSFFWGSLADRFSSIPFPTDLFPLESTVDPKDFCTTLVSLQRATPNQALQPTALLRHAYDIDLTQCDVPYFRLRFPEPWLSF